MTDSFERFAMWGGSISLHFFPSTPHIILWFLDSLEMVGFYADGKPPRFWELRWSPQCFSSAAPQKPWTRECPGGTLMLCSLTEVIRSDSRQQWLLRAPGAVSTSWWLDYDAALARCGGRWLSPVLAGEWPKLIAVSFTMCWYTKRSPS